MHIMTLKMKFIQCPRLAFFEKKSSRVIIVIIYIYIIYLIGLTLCPTLCLILCSFFLMPKNIKSLIYRIMRSLNTLDFVSDFVSHFVSHFVSDQYQRGISLKKHFQIASKPLNDRMVKYHNRPSPDLTRQEAVIVHSISTYCFTSKSFQAKASPILS